MVTVAAVSKERVRVVNKITMTHTHTPAHTPTLNPEMRIGISLRPCRCGQTCDIHIYLYII